MLRSERMGFSTWKSELKDGGAEMDSYDMEYRSELMEKPEDSCV
jgi:hypothetical protein